MSSIKKIAFLIPRPGMDLRDFLQYWRHIHGPLVSTSPDYGLWRLYYAQNHPMRPGPIGKPFAYSGMAVFVLPGESSNEDSFSQTAIYRERIEVDERKFIDMNRTFSFGAKTFVVVEGHGAGKIVILAAKPRGVPRGIFQQLTCESASAAAPELSRLGMVGWVVNSVIPGTSRLPGGRADVEVDIDIVHEIWFQDQNLIDWREVFRILQETLIEKVDSHDSCYSSFFAEEIVFFSKI